MEQVDGVDVGVEAEHGENPSSGDHTVWQRLARATASSRDAFSPSYGWSTPIRRANGTTATSPLRAASSASSMLCRAMSCWALAVYASRLRRELGRFRLGQHGAYPVQQPRVDA